MQNGKAQSGGIKPVNSEAPAPRNEQASLKAIVREALLAILDDSGASAAAKASAGRTLLEYFADESAIGKRRGADMTAAELDSAISQMHPKRPLDSDAQ